MSGLRKNSSIRLTMTAFIGTGIAMVFLYIVLRESNASGTPPGPLFKLERKVSEVSNDPHGATPVPTNLIPDFYREKYDPRTRVEFHVTSPAAIAIFVESTGVQIQTESGWKVANEEPRNEIWRLKPGTVRDLYVEGLSREKWRAYIRYGIEMKGFTLFRARLHQAWLTRSFANWTGKAWGGGGPWSGSYELYSEEFNE